MFIVRTCKLYDNFVVTFERKRPVVAFYGCSGWEALGIITLLLWAFVMMLMFFSWLLWPSKISKVSIAVGWLIGPILSGHSVPLCHAFSLLSLLMSLWTSMHRWHATVAKLGEWQCKIRTGSVQRLAMANGPNIFEMLLVKLLRSAQTMK